jgi:RHS repeat-associated protein
MAMNQTAGAHKYLYNGKELQNELNLDWYDYGARFYDAAVGRFFTQDRFAEKYNDFSPYQYAANNPILFIDVNGDSINVAALMANDFRTLVSTLFDLSAQTGLNLSVDKNGNLTYGKNTKTNEPLVASVDGMLQGSETARNDLIAGINSTDLARVGPSNIGSKAPLGGSEIWLDGKQIEGNIKGTSEGLNNKTMGYGLTFMHEYYHTSLGGTLQDPKDRSNMTATGGAVDRVNKIRGELDSNYYNNSASEGFYGQRKHYYAYPSLTPYIDFKLPDGKSRKLYTSTPVK